MKKKQDTGAAQNTSNLTDEEIRIRAEQRKRAARKKRKKIIKSVIIALAFLALVLVVLSWFFKIKRVEKEAESLTTYTVSRRDIEEVLSATGTLMPADSYTVSARAQGDILECHFEEGDDVNKDDVLYVIDSSDMDSTRRQREMTLENAVEDYNDLVADRNKLNTYSQYSGTITELYVEAGDTIREDQVIADIVDKRTMLIDLPFFEVDALGMNIGDAMSVIISGTGEVLYGTVDEISVLTGVSPMGVITRDVTVRVQNPGGITKNTVASAEYAADIASCGTSSFYYSVEKQILASYGGDIKLLAVSEGQTIYEGALVLTLDGDDLEKSIKRASQSLENAQMSFDNTLESIEDYTIKAPITGTVIEKYYNAGESIDNTSGSKTVAIIYDLSSLTFDMNIDELDIFSIAKGQEVTITSDAYSGRKFKGEITKISKVGSTSSGTTVYPVTVTISDQEALEALLPGMNIDAEIIINKSENVISVPTGAVARGNTVKVVKKQENNGDETQKNPGNATQVGTQTQKPSGNMVGTQLYGTVPGDTEFEIIKVQTGVSDDDYIEIVSGLSEGDVVIIEQRQASSFFESMMGMHGGMMGGMPAGGMSGGMPTGGMSGDNRGNMGGNRQGGTMPGGR